MNPAFADTTCCPECASNQIYVLSDDGSGMCWKCKILIPGPIVGGFGYLEAMRLYGVIGTGKSANEKDREEEVKNSLNKGIADFSKAAGIRKEHVLTMFPPKKPDGPVPVPAPKPSKPGFGKRLTGVFGKLLDKVADKLEAAMAKKPKEAQDKAASTVHLFMDKEASPSPSVKADTEKKFEAPMPGQSWSVGPCKTCGLASRKSGSVTRCKANGARQFIEISVSGFGAYYGCFMCARKI